MSDYDISVASTRGYASLLKKIDKWTTSPPGASSSRVDGLPAVEVDGVPVTAVNANAGSETRNHFLHAFLNQEEDRYTAYWTVRSCIGEGACGEANPTVPKRRGDTSLNGRFYPFDRPRCGYINDP